MYEHREFWFSDFIQPIWRDNDMTSFCEIGVAHGSFANFIEGILRPKRLVGIDPYIVYNDRHSYDYFFKTQENLDALYNKVAVDYRERAYRELYRETSEEAVSRFEDESFDIVYIDGHHDYEYVKQDCELWWPKVKRGGMMIGDDYIPKGDVDFGVIPAVDDFANEMQLDLQLAPTKVAQWWFTKVHF